MWSSFARFSSAANAFNAEAQCGRLGFCSDPSPNVENPPLVFPNAGVLPGADTGKAAETEEWEEVDLYQKANWYPDAVEQYASGWPRETPISLRLSCEEEVRMHLACLGWRIELNKGTGKFRYTSPTRHELHHSLSEVCQILAVPKSADHEEVPNFQSVPIVDPNPESVAFVVDGVEEEKEVPSSKSEAIARDWRKQEQLNKFNEEAKYDPGAVLEWIELKRDVAPGRSGAMGEVSLRVKKHLLSVGWDLFYIDKSCSSGGGRRSELRYRPPPPFNSKAHISLINACNFLVKQGLAGSQELPERKKRVPVTCEVERRKIARGNGTDGSARSKVQGCKSVTGWLIDGKVVEEMAQVYYRSRKGDAKLKEGWVTREGIKCKCCHQVFNLTGFEAHAGSSNHRPAANIILADGTSLFHLQTQLNGRP